MYEIFNTLKEFYNSYINNIKTIAINVIIQEETNNQ